jgi:DNA-binding transcriptional LysR family regulator
LSACARARADLGFVEGPDLPPGLASHEVGADRLTVVVPPGHRWEKRRSGITAAELAATPLVTRELGSGTRRYFEDALRGQGGLDHVPPVAELSSTTAIKSAVAAGIGLSRRLLAVWAAGRQLTGPAADLRTIAAAGDQRRSQALGREPTGSGSRRGSGGRARLRA